MPGSVSNASVADSLPAMLYASFTEQREYAVQGNVYANGESQTRNLVTTSRKAWQITARLTAAAMATFDVFYAAKGRTNAFQFTPLNETAKNVVFSSALQKSSGMARVTVTFSLLEVT